MILTTLQPSLHSAEDWTDLLITEAEVLATNRDQESVKDAQQLRAEFEALAIDDPDELATAIDELRLDAEDIINGLGLYVYNDNDSLVVSDEPLEPEPEDWVTEDYVNFSAHESLARWQATSPETWAKELAEHMTESNFWPNVWHVSDHGNYELLKDWIQEETS
jgi:hypothetical protein